MMRAAEHGAYNRIHQHMSTFRRSAATAAMALGLLAAAPPQADDRATLARASSPSILYPACDRLVVALIAQTAYGAPAPRDAERDADAAAVIAFLHSGHDVATRGRCARDFAARTNVHVIDIGKSEWHSAYGTDATDAVITLLHAPDAEMRIDACKALHNMLSRPIGRALLHAAQTDTDPRVKDAAFRSLPWPMRADVNATHDAVSYRRAIVSALHANDPIVVPGALLALAGLDGLNADRTLRSFAGSPNATIRAGAIDAYDAMMAFDPSIVRFIESRLTDPSPVVRDAVMQRLFMMADHHAIPAIQTLARTAPTKTERKSAAEFARAVRSQPDMSKNIH